MKRNEIKIRSNVYQEMFIEKRYGIVYYYYKIEKVDLAIQFISKYLRKTITAVLSEELTDEAKIKIDKHVTPIIAGSTNVLFNCSKKIKELGIAV